MKKPISISRALTPNAQIIYLPRHNIVKLIINGKERMKFNVGEYSEEKFNHFVDVIKMKYKHLIEKP
jgi:hypothetical protein